MSIFRIILWTWIELVINLKFRDIQHISTEKLADWLNKKDREKPLLLDARKAAEYQVSHLQNARLIPDAIADINTWKEVTLSTPIVVYCSVGYRSAKTARKLQNLGYKQVYNLNGSLFKWYNEGRSIYQENKTVNLVHPYNKFWEILINKPS